MDDFFNWPWMVAGEMGDWMLTDAQVKTLREYLLRGGFIYMDDFWGPEEYARFAESMTRVFPDRPVVEIGNDDSIFHAVYDLDDRYQVLGQWSLRGGGGWMGQRAAGTKAHWMGIYDDHNRLMVAMTFNCDVGDSWEWADSPTLSREVLGAGDPAGRELRGLLDDALNAMGSARCPEREESGCRWRPRHDRKSPHGSSESWPAGSSDAKGIDPVSWPARAAVKTGGQRKCR